MVGTVQDAYLESRVLSATPLELVRILYRLAIERLREAKAHQAAGDVTARSKSLTKTSEILAELTVSLDMARGGALSARLAALYQYMQSRLLEANFRQDMALVDEVIGLLSTLLEAWQQIEVPHPAAPVAESAAFNAAYPHRVSLDLSV
ncbi:MAG: flagellar export chaperone FliS [Bryobacterales bacterium]|nr:flagellar export chaperone FliS [Bryobacteraceae bacterium]MDW8131984.1 flagellar export chaperone FliS [Bryobacterales bacterium]MDW8355272.1 flagellar export chaperone FliS [Bryobacterales bacterium]